MTSGWRLLALLPLLLVLAGCGSLDDEEVAALEELPGVLSSYSGCYKGECLLTVALDDAADPTDLVSALAAARETGADEIEVRLVADGERVADLALLDAEPGQAEEDPALVDAVLAATRVPGVTAVDVEVESQATRAHVVAEEVAPSRVWDLAEEAWAELRELPGPTLVADNGGGPGGRRVTTSEGRFPRGTVALARTLDAEAGSEVSGIDVRTDEVVVGVRRLADVAAIERRLPRPGPVRVVVTDHVLAYTGEGEAQRRAVLRVVQDHPGVAPHVEGLVLTLGGTDAGAVARAVADVRTRAPAAAAEVPIRALLDDTHEVQLGTTGSPDLVRLAGALRGPRTTTVDVRTGYDPDEPGWVQVELRAPDLRTGVLRVARVLRAHAGALTSLGVTVKAVDAEGRSPTSTAELTRVGGRWEVEVDRPDLRPADVGVAWRRGLGDR